MKKNILFIVFLFGICTTIFSQNINLTKQELESTLCKHWELDYVMMGDIKIGDNIGTSEKLDYQYKSNGEYDLISEVKITGTGKWIYYSDKKYIELSINNKVTSQIIGIDNDKLIMILVSDEKGPPGLPNLVIHFKPIK